MERDRDADDVHRGLEAVARAIVEKDAPARLARDPRAFLIEAGLSPAEADRLAGESVARLLLYRKLVRRGLVRGARAVLPRTAARLGDRFDALVEAFLEGAAPRSHYYRDVAAELVQWAAPRLRADPAISAWILDWAQHELDETSIERAGDDDGPTGLELALDRAVRFAKSARVARRAHAVHRLSEDADARDEPDATPVALLGYRDAEHAPRWLELTPLAAAILERLLAGEPLGDAMRAATAAEGHALDAAVIESTARLLEDLEARGVLLGAEPGPGPGSPEQGR